MKKRGKITEKRVALVCAVVLVLLSVYPVVRKTDVVTEITSRFFGSGQVETVADSTENDIQQTEEVADEETVAESKTEDIAESSEFTEANSADEAAESTEKTESAEQPKVSSAGEYTYVAEAGDSYTVFARQSVDKYLTEKQAEASSEQRLVAEVTLTNAAGAPYLEIGDKVVIQKSAVAAALGDDAETSTASVKMDRAVESKESGVKDFEHTAVSGDSYITIVRAAISQNGGTELTNAQRVAAETKLAAQAGWPAVDVAEVVKVNATDLKPVLDEVRAMSADQQQAWQTYADMIVW